MDSSNLDEHNKNKSSSFNNQSGSSDEENVHNNKSKVSNKSHKTHKPKVRKLRLYKRPIPKFESANTLQNSAHNVIFNRELRFQVPKRQSTEAIYMPKILKEPPAAGIGYGHKYITFGHNDNPSPSAYHFKSIFEDNLLKGKGPTMCFKKKEPKVNRNPGPGEYKARNNWISPLGVSIAERRNFYYDELMRGKVFISPQRYHIRRNFIDSQRYGEISFGYGNKSNIVNSKTPGVGSYNLPYSFDLSRGKMPIN